VTDDQAQVTKILDRLDGPDGPAAQELLPLVYEELRRLARAYFDRQGAAHTLQPTALVHEAFMRLADDRGADWSGRDHFFAVAAMAMRQILVDHARRRKARKRGGDWDRVTLEAAVAPSGTDLDVVDLDEALQRLAAHDPRQARVVTLRFFGGLSNEAVADVLGVSRATVANDWRFARAWLAGELRRGGES
jgi:RNA polymerase sigma factor (TIGR02999 family)